MTNASGIPAGVSAGSEGTMVAIGADVHGEVADAPFDIDEDEAAWRAQVAGFAHSVCAFDPAVFEDTDDEDSEQTVALAAGALVLASKMLLDEELEDIATLKQQAGTVASNGEMFLALGELPPRFADGYDGRFARKFLVATVMVEFAGVDAGLSGLRVRRAGAEGCCRRGVRGVCRRRIRRRRGRIRWW